MTNQPEHLVLSLINRRQLAPGDFTTAETGGVTLTDVLQMDVQSLTKVLPRISEPALTEADIRNMDPADLVQLGTAVSGFLLAKRFKESED